MTAAVPFAASLRALDASQDVATNFSGMVQLTAVARAASPTLLISEVAARITRSVELCNVSDAPVNVSGWRLTFYDASTWPAPRATFVVPSVTVCPPRMAFRVTAGGNSPGDYPAFFLGTNLAWSSNLPDNPIAVLLRDGAGNEVDFFCACGGYPFLIDSPASIPSDSWRGLPSPPNTFSTRSYQRIGGLDHNNAADWLIASATLGSPNTGLRFPFSGPLRKYHVSPATVQFSQGQWQGSLTLDQPASGVWVRADDGAGLVGDSSIFDVLAGPPLALELPAGGTEATAGLLGAGRVLVPEAPPTNVTITLSMALQGEVSLPGSVIVQAGQTNVTFAVTNLDDALLDGTRSVTVIASAPGFASASGVITNADDEIGLLTVTVPANAGEGDGVLVGAGRLSVNQPVGIDYEVALTSNNTNEVQVPTSAFIAIGQTSALFNVTISNDAYLDGLQIANVQASASGWISSSAQIVIADNENPTLRLELYDAVEEGRGIVPNAVRVTLGGLAASNVVASLVSQTTARLRVPPTIEIPAGQSSALTHFIVLDDPLTNGLETVQVNASAPGFLDASSITHVRDNDLHHFFVAPIPTAQVSGQPFSVTVYARAIDGYIPSTYAGEATLRALGHAGSRSVSPSNLTFAAGEWNGAVIITGESRNTILTVDDGLGHSGGTNPFDVALMSTSGPPVSDLVYDALRGQIVAGVLSHGGIESNSVVGIDPATRHIIWSVPLGTEPGRLALSDDIRFVYVGGNTTGGLVRVDLNVRAVSLRFPLGSDATFGPYYAEDLEVMPGHPLTVVVSRKVAFGAYNQGLAVYDGGVQRPDLVGPGPHAFGYYVGFYGISNKLHSPSADGMRLVAVGRNGLTKIDSRAGAFYATDFEFDGGLLYGTSGTVFWPETLRIMGAFPASGWLRPDAASGRLAFLDSDRLRVFDQNSYAELGTLNLTVTPASPASLIRCGADRLAFRGADNRLVILRTDMIPIPAATELFVAQTASEAVLTVGNRLVYQIVVSNAGPALATNVLVVDQLPAGAAFVSAVPSQGTCGQTNGIVNCQLGAIGSDTAVSVAVTALITTPGAVVNTARVIGGALNPTNDVSYLTNFAIFGAVLPGVTEIQCNAVDLAYDAASNRLWTSTSVQKGELLNRLEAIDLNSGLVGASIDANVDVGQVAISHNGQYLYAVTDHGDVIRRFNLWTLNEDLRVPQSGGFGVSVTDLKVLPHTPSAIAVAFRGASLLEDIYVYDNGVPRPLSPIDHGCAFIEFSASPARLYGTSWRYAPGNFHRMNVSPTGVELADVTSGLLTGTPDIRFAGGLLFSTEGDVVDPELPTRVAALPVSGHVQPDLSVGKVFYLGQNLSTAQWVLTAFDIATLSVSWAVPMPAIMGNVNSLVGCASGVLAFSTTAEQVFIVNTTSLSQTVAADLEVWFDPATSAGLAGSPFTFTGIVRNNGPAPAMNVIVTNRFSPGTVLLSDSASGGTRINVGGGLVCQFSNLVVGGAAWFTLTTTRTNAGMMVVSATATSGVLDPVLTNNTTAFSAHTHVPPSADLAVSDSFLLGPGGEFVYTIVASNAGPDAAEDVMLTDVYPDRATLLSVLTTQGSLVTNSGNISVNFSTIPPGAAATASMTVEPLPSAVIINRGEISSATPDPFLANNDFISVATPEGVALVTKVALLAEDFAYDAVHRRLYASVPSNGGPLSNSIVAIDPDTGAFTQQLRFLEPVGKLALSDNGQYLYAGLAQTGGVLRISTTTGIVEARILLADARVAFDLAPIPGQPQSIAVCSRWLPLGYDPGIEIYDDTTMRANTVVIGSGASYFFLAFPTSPDRLYAHGYGGFHVLPVDPMGVSFTGPTVDTIPGTDFVVDQGLAYFDSGHVLNPETQTLVGTFPFAIGFVAPDLASNRVYFLPQKGSSLLYTLMKLQAFQPEAFSELWSLAFWTPPGVERGFLKLGSGEFAVRTDGSRSRILIVRTSPLDASAADVSLTAIDSPDPVSVGGIMTYALSVRNDGLWNATNVVVTNALPMGMSFISASASQGSCMQSNGIVACWLGPLANGDSATVTIQGVANATGVMRSQFWVSDSFSDPNLFNNAAVVDTSVNPPPAMAIADAAVLEGNSRTPITFPLTLSRSSTLPVAVEYATADGTATAGLDYDLTEGVITFPPGTTNRTITLSPGIRGNAMMGSNRFFFIKLGNPTNAALARSQATGWIVEDDFNSINVQSSPAVEGNAARSQALLTFTLTADSNAVTVDYATFDGTAIAQSDYLPRAGSLVFLPGTSNLTLAIPVLGDVCNEPDETFLLQLSAVGALLTVNEVMGRILNDDPVPSLRILSLAPAGNGWTIQFTSACGQFYRLQRSETAAPFSWLTVADRISGTGETVTVDDGAAPPSRQAFYRVELLP